MSQFPVLCAALLALPAAPAAGRIVRIDPPEGAAFRCIAWSPDGRTLAAGGSDGRVHLFDAESTRERDGLAPGGDAISALAFAPDGRHLAIGGDGLVYWDLTAGRPAWTKEDFAPIVLAFSPDGSRLAAGQSGIGSVSVLDPATGDARQVGFRRRGFDFSDPCLAFSADNRTLLAGRRRAAYFLDATSGQPLPPLTGGRRFWFQAAFSADGRTALTLEAPYDREVWVVRRWEWATGQQAGRFETEQVGASLVASPDCRRLAWYAWPEGVRLWDACAGQPLDAAFKPDRSLSAIRFAPDGKSLALLDNDGRAWLWAPAVAVPTPAVARCQVEADALWASLGADATSAYRAMDVLAAEPDAAVAVLAECLGAGDPPSPADLTALLADLGSPALARRRDAERALAGLGLRARPALLAAARSTESAEVRARLARVLGADPLRRRRTEQVLESLGTAAARRLLADLRDE